MTTKGFLLVDAQMNTIIIPWDDEELIETVKRKSLKVAHRHNTLKELDSDIRNYLKGKYEEKE